MKQGKHLVTIHGTPRGWKAYIQWGAAWFLKGFIYDTDVTIPGSCSLQHNIFHLGLGRPEPCWPAGIVVTLYEISPPHLLLPTT